MKHYIIVKFTELVDNKAELIESVRQLFEAGEPIDGVKGYNFYPNCVNRPNRYDLMIEIDMAANALENWDNSALHKAWKDVFGQYVEKKAIFDCQ